MSLLLTSQTVKVNNGSAPVPEHLEGVCECMLACEPMHECVSVCECVCVMHCHYEADGYWRHFDQLLTRSGECLCVCVCVFV